MKKITLDLPAGNGTRPGKISAARRRRWNAVSHGLCARTILLPGENAEQFALLQRELEKYYRPVGPVEEFTVFEIGLLIWQKLRFFQVEAAEIVTSSASARLDRVQSWAASARVQAADRALINDLANPIASHRAVEILTRLRDEFVRRGHVMGEDTAMLQAVYGIHGMGSGFPSNYLQSVRTDSEMCAQGCANPEFTKQIVGLVDDEIQRINIISQDMKEIEASWIDVAEPTALALPAGKTGFTDALCRASGSID